MAYKDFQAADVLTAQEVDTYLMRQAVMVFASAAARNSALTNPVEGMMTYLQDTNRFQIFDGSAWAGFSTTGSLLADTAVTADTGGPDGGLVMRRWTGNSGWTGIATTGMTSTEYMLISEGTNTYMSSGTGGQAGIRGPSNDVNNAVYATSNGVVVNGKLTSPQQPYCQMRGSGGNWFQGTGRRLRDGDPGAFTWAVQYNVGSHFSTTTGLFVAPVTGVYLCMWQTYQNNYGSNGYIHWLWEVGGSFTWNNGQVPYNIFGYDKGAYADGVSTNMMIYVTAGNGIGISGHMGGDERFYSDYSYMAIRLLG